MESSGYSEFFSTLPENPSNIGKTPTPETVMIFVLDWWRLIGVMTIGPIFFKVLSMLVISGLAFIPAMFSRNKYIIVGAIVEFIVSTIGSGVLGGLLWLILKGRVMTEAMRMALGL